MLTDDTLKKDKTNLLLEFIKDFDIGKAAKRAGVSRADARRTVEASSADIAELLERRTERTRIDSDWVVVKLQEIFESDLGDVLTPSGAVRPVSEWPPVWRKVVSSVRIREVTDPDGETSGRVVDMKTPDVLRALELIGKHVNVNAFRERVEVTTLDDVVQRLRRGRDRLARAKAEGSAGSAGSGEDG